ncbi:hypothetical protein [Streptomyces hygroscopicus]|uniref:hypothetical protein n=1 Tax=Streptomyces hygroscopicus TaxID=1912 RepID=UPI002240A1F4|nr:hypothetical protein [Streptomyces hygroscopicus]
MFTLVSSAARTTNGNSGPLQLGGAFDNITLEVIVSAVSGTTPSMALSVQWSVDGTDFGPVDGTADTFAAITAAGNVVKELPVRAPYMQISWTLTGTTPSFTFAVDAATD